MQMSLCTRSLSVSFPTLSLKRALRTTPQRKEDASTVQSFRRTRSVRQAASDTASPEVEKASVDEKSDDVVGTVVISSLVNSPWLRTAAVVGTLLLASAYLQKPLPGQYLRLTHVYAFASWFGSTIWVLLLSPKLMFDTLGRQTFGRLQMKLFPQFFGFSVFVLILMLGTKPVSGIPYTLIVALIASVIQWSVLEPIISSAAAERYVLERAEVRDEAKIAEVVKKCSRFHGMSSSLGLITLCCAVTHGYILSTQLAF